ncbi:hypothetical protein JB92DRAFT_2824967 [Gautieria morchelliformis]|nr:hypothetical protein JB92DRAFT_2824967 [Gautieria morchelliformis]
MANDANSEDKWPNSAKGDQSEHRGGVRTGRAERLGIGNKRVMTVRPDFQGELREEVEQWVVEAEGIQAELRTAMRMEAIIDPAFERPSDVDDLAKEVKLVKEWLESLVFTLSPAFLDSEMNPAPGSTASQRPSKEPEVGETPAKASEVERGAVKGPKAERSIVTKATAVERGTVKEPKVEGSTVKEPKANATFGEDPVLVVEPPVVSPECSRPISTTQAEPDDAPTPKKAQTELGPQPPISEPARSPSPEIIAIKLTPAQCRKGRANALLAESDKVPQSVVKQGYPDPAYLLGWKIYIRGCVSPEEYEAKEEKDAQEAEVKEWGAKGKAKSKAKDKSSVAGHSSISLKGILDTFEGTRTSMLAAEEKVEELVERSEDLMRNVSVKLNALNGAVLELEGVQAMIRKLMK